MFRVASVSKIVVGQTLALLLADHGIGWDTDVSDALGWRLRNPAFPDIPITFAALASHTAGLDDTRGYLLAEGQLLQDFMLEGRFHNNQNKTYFVYSNLGYIIIAELIEKLSGRDFADAVAPLVSQGGFNWANVSERNITNALPTYRREGDVFRAQIDDPPQPAAPTGSVARYSPQGGLRLSLSGMLTLAEWLPQADQRVLWRRSDGPGNYLDGVFEDYGAGLQIFTSPSFYPRPLIGHFGNAYGFNGGVWYDAQADIAFAYALNGLELGDEADCFSDAERDIFSAVAEIED